MSDRFRVIVNQRTYLVADARSGRCLGAVGSNFYRTFVFPLYTPAGVTVLREFPFDHPFHNGLFVAQSPVIVSGRVGNFWATPPLRGRDDRLGADMGRTETPDPPRIEPHQHGVKFIFKLRWLDEEDRPMLEEVRTVDFRAGEDATVCDVCSEKIARYGPAEFPQSKFGSVGIRVEPRLLPAAGGAVLADGGRRGTAEVAHEQDSDFVAYENDLPTSLPTSGRQAGGRQAGGRQAGGRQAGLAAGARFGVLMTILDEGVRGPWFLRDYGMALYNPTWRKAIATPEGESWTLRLRVVAYDGQLTARRAESWRRQPSAV